MSDFSDLWTSSNPSETQKPTLSTLGATAGPINSSGSRGSTPDTFNLLASARSSQPNSRPITPAVPRPSSSALKPSNTTKDAFGELLSLGNGSSRDGNLTIAEKAARAEQERKAEQERRQNSRQDHTAFNSHGAFWDQFDATPAAKSTPSTSAQGDLWDLGLPATVSFSTRQPRPATAPSSDDDLLSDFGFSSSTVQPSTSKVEEQLFPMASTLVPAGPSRSNTPGSFDFGNREDSLLGSHAVDSDNDDILGELSRPVDAFKQPVCLFSNVVKMSHTISLLS